MLHGPHGVKEAVQLGAVVAGPLAVPAQRAAWGARLRHGADANRDRRNLWITGG